MSRLDKNLQRKVPANKKWCKSIKAFHSKRGEGYVDVVVGVIVAMLLIVVVLNVFTLLALKQNMDYFARELLKVATINGRASGTEIADRYMELYKETNVACSYSLTAAEFYNTSNASVQYGDTITVSVTYRTYLGGLGAVCIPVTLTATYSGLSQKYWK